MTPALRAEMMRLAEGKSGGSAAIELSADELFQMVDMAVYPPMNSMTSYSGRFLPAKAQAAVDGLAKLGFDKGDLDTLRKYFDHAAKAEELREDAARALGRLRDEFFDDRRKAGVNDSNKAQLRAY